MSIYDFTMKDAQGEQVDLSQYRGKVLLVVNTATGCGFTPQYEGLENLYKTYQARGFEILDFPCNQFGNQAPGTSDEIHTFCTGRFGITFPQFEKIDVNGDNAIPLYKWLTENTKFQGFDGAAGLVMSGIAKKMDKDYKNNGKIKWNFTKFLINREGEIVARFEPTKDKKVVKETVEKYL